MTPSRSNLDVGHSFPHLHVDALHHCFHLFHWATFIKLRATFCDHLFDRLFPLHCACELRLHVGDDIGEVLTWPDGLCCGIHPNSVHGGFHVRQSFIDCFAEFVLGRLHELSVKSTSCLQHFCL